MTTILKTDRLTLRPFARSDAPRVAAYAAEWELARMTSSIPHPYTPAMAETFVAADPTDSPDLSLAIDDGDGLVGTGLLKRSKGCELGYWIGAPHRGKGFAKEAGAALCGYAFDALGVETIEACVFKDNPASLRVLTALGFIHVYDCVDDSIARGQAVSSAHLALTRADWRALQEARR